MPLNDLVIDIAGDASDFNRATDQVRRGLFGLSAAASGLRIGFTGLAASLAPLAAVLAPLTAAFAAFQGLKSSIGIAAEAEQTAISFEVMTGSIENATQLVGELRTMGAETPFEFMDLAGATKTLLSFGRTQQQVLGDLDMLSNVAQGDAEKLSSLAVVFGQVSANARLTGGDLLQFINVGFNPLNEIAEKTGESMTQLRKRMEQGKIGIAEVEEAFRAATSEGGLFFGMNRKQSQSLLGLWSTFKDNISAVMLELGNAIVEAFDFKGILQESDTFLSNFRTSWLPSIKRVIQNVADGFRGFVDRFQRDWLPQIRAFVGDVIARFKDWLPQIQHFGQALQDHWLPPLRETLGLLGDLERKALAIAPSMIEAFGAIGDAVREVVSLMRDGLEFLDQIGFTAGAISAGMGPQETAEAFAEWKTRPMREAMAGAAGLGHLLTEAKKAAESIPKPDLPQLKFPEAKPAAAPAPISRNDFAPNRSFEVGTQAAFEKIFAALGGTGDKKKPEKQTADNTKEANKLLTRAVRILEQVERKIGKVEEVEFIA